MFKEKLKDAVESVRGGEAAIVMGYDGIPVDSYVVDTEIDIETVGMEFSVVLKEVRKAAELLERGEAEELTIRTDQLITVMRVLNDEYFVAMIISPDGNLGKARYRLRLVAPEFANDLS